MNDGFSGEIIETQSGKVFGGRKHKTSKLID